MNNKLALIIGLTLAASTLTAHAGDIPLQGPLPFSSMDSNGDNKVTPQEYVDAHNQRKQLREQAGMPKQRRSTPAFTDFDSNADGILTEQELNEGRQAMGRGGQQAGMGMGGGGQRGRNMPSFADFDSNGDGKLMKEEFYDARAQRMYKRADEGYPLRNAAQAPDFESIDSNGDGVIDEQEFSTHQAEHMRMRQR